MSARPSRPRAAASRCACACPNPVPRDHRHRPWPRRVGQRAAGGSRDRAHRRDADLPVRQSVRRHRHGVTHVIRGEDLLSSTPRQLALYSAVGAEPPIYCHLPMVLGPDKKRLSKRHGAVSVEEFRDRGVLAEALINYVALLGWSFDDHTNFMTREELVARFSLERITASPGVFDVEKLEWLNGEHLRALSPDAFADGGARASPVAGFAARRPARTGARGGAARAGEAARARPVRGHVRVSVRAGRDRSRRPGRRSSGRPTRRGRSPRRAPSWPRWPTGMPRSIEGALRAACEAEGLKPRVLYAPVRVAITGSTVSPGLYESLELLGRERVARAARRRIAREGTAG